jgi:hypothetical protein
MMPPVKEDFSIYSNVADLVVLGPHIFLSKNLEFCVKHGFMINLYFQNAVYVGSDIALF